MSPKVYLAGPDVFLPDAVLRAAQMKAICAQHGLTGVSPLDPLEDAPAAWDELPEAFRLHRRNEVHIRACDALVANLTPFRGPSADVGTVFELGFMRALGRPVFGYATTSVPFLDRTRSLIATEERHGICYDPAGMVVESFGLFDNLMLDGAIAASGGRLFVEECGEARWTDLSVFTRCVQALALSLK